MPTIFLQATTDQPKKKKEEEKTEDKFLFNFSSFLIVYLLFKCRFVAWRRGFPRKFAYCVSVS